MTDNREEIAAALAAANVPENAIADAVAIFQANARHESDGWYVGSLMKGTLTRAVAKFLETRPHFIGTPKPAGDDDRTPRSVFERDDYPRDHTGRPLPMDALTSDQLFELAGENPSQKDPDLWQVQDADFAHSGIEPLDDDELEPDEVPPPKGKTYTRAELEKLSQDQLYIAAGSGPTK